MTLIRRHSWKGRVELSQSVRFFPFTDSLLLHHTKRFDEFCLFSPEMRQPGGAAGVPVLPARGAEDDGGGAQSQTFAKDGHHRPLR